MYISEAIKILSAFSKAECLRDAIGFSPQSEREFTEALKVLLAIHSEEIKEKEVEEYYKNLKAE